MAQLQRLARLPPRGAAEGTATEYASIVQLIVGFVDRMRTQRDDQIVVLIPVVIPTRWRYRILHNQLNLVLSHALQARPTEYARSPLECHVASGSKGGRSTAASCRGRGLADCWCGSGGQLPLAGVNNGWL